MDEDDAWFAPRRFGIGAGRPISWQGWLLTIAFAVVAVGLGRALGDRPAQLIPLMVLLITVFLVIAARTTRGGWRWRWGEDE